MVQPLPHNCQRYVLLIMPPMHSSTAAVYANYRHNEAVHEKLMQRVRYFLRLGDLDGLLTQGINSLCDAILELARSCNTGVYQLAGPRRVSRLEFGLLAADIFGLDKSLISGISIEAFVGRDNRPRDCSMSNEKAAGTLSTPFLSISAGLREMASHVPP